MALIDGLISYWKLDEASGNRADAHGSYTMTDNNTVGVEAGVINDAASCIRANNEHLSNTAFGGALINSWSFSGWMKFPNIGAADQTLFSLRQPSGNNNLAQFECNMSIPQLRFIAFNSAGTYVKDYRKTTGFTVDAWTHIVVTWDGSTLELYVNGTNSGVTKTVDSAMTQTSTTRTLRLGAETATSNVTDGAFDEFGVWNRALTSAEVTELYGSGTPPAYPFSVPTVAVSKLLLLGVT